MAAIMQQGPGSTSQGQPGVGMGQGPAGGGQGMGVGVAEQQQRQAQAQQQRQAQAQAQSHAAAVAASQQAGGSLHGQGGGQGNLGTGFPPLPYGNGGITTDSIQKYLDENQQLILAILDNQNMGKLKECAQYQARLQQNLMYLAAIADAQPTQGPMRR